MRFVETDITVKMVNSLYKTISVDISKNLEFVRKEIENHMDRFEVKALDCTLRDGGYINNWRWGYRTARNIILQLIRADVDIIEVGFLRNVAGYDPDTTVCNTIEELNRLLPDNYEGKTMFSCMAMRSNYDINKLSDYSGHGIEIIRITAHDYDIKEGLEFAKIVKSKGYEVSVNPINIMGYSDQQILWIVDQVNEIHPYQFTIVDTFGSMKRRDLDRISSLVDNNLDKDIRLALHLHENMALSCCLAQNFVDKHFNRSLTIDGSLMGMGRIPGNLPIELLTDYLNDYVGKNYDIDYLMDAIQDYIAPLKGETQWGYTPAYFLSARFNLHRDYAEHYLAKSDLTNRDINHILSHFDKSKGTVYDASYADKLYEEYMNNIIDDSKDKEVLRTVLLNKNIIILAPGASVKEHIEDIKKYVKKNNAVVLSVNFIPDMLKVDYAFFSNNKRFDLVQAHDCKIIVTSNLPGEHADYQINYNSLSGAFTQGSNSLVMTLKLLHELGVKEVYLAGADGFKTEGDNYYSGSMRNNTAHDGNYNLVVSAALQNSGVKITFLTPSEYKKSLNWGK